MREQSKLYSHVVNKHSHVDGSLAARLKHLMDMKNLTEDAKREKARVQDRIRKMGNDLHNKELLENPEQGWLVFT